jgi:hypothetical protein
MPVCGSAVRSYLTSECSCLRSLAKMKERSLAGIASAQGFVRVLRAVLLSDRSLTPVTCARERAPLQANSSCSAYVKVRCCKLLSQTLSSPLASPILGGEAVSDHGD